MSRLVDFTTYRDASQHFSKGALWSLFSGNSDRMNIVHECIDRHTTSSEPAIQIAYADGHDEVIDFKAMSRAASQVAHFLADRGVQPGDRVAVMIDPSFAFYATLLGSIKFGAIAVPMFTLFGPDSIRLRVSDCQPTIFFCGPEKQSEVEASGVLGAIVVNEQFLENLSHFPAEFSWNTRGSDLAVLQYTSGTTKQLPTAVRHSHKSIVTLMVAALYGTGIRPGDKFFCPSSPAWGHGLWHGTFAPWALGVPTGTLSGRFDPARLLHALSSFGVTNLSAAATHYRMIRNSGIAENYSYSIKKLSFTGEPIDSETSRYVESVFGTPVCSMYGTTETGVIIANYPGASDFQPREGALGKPVPGVQVDVHRPDGSRAAPDEVGELVLLKRDGWYPTKDLAHYDVDGFFYHGGRADDIIISAGWTMSAIQIEDAILHHPAVTEAAAIGVPDSVRGQVVKAFLVLNRELPSGLVEEVQELVRKRLSRAEYPRHVEVVNSLPKTEAGKINRKLLRELESRRREENSKP